jgi:hypothetical protein
MACVLLIVFWVRSYWWCDSGTGKYKSQKYRMVSCRGSIGFASVPLLDFLDRPPIDAYGNEVYPCEWESRQIVSRGDYLLSDDDLIIFARTDVTTPGRVSAFGLPLAGKVAYWQLAAVFATFSALGVFVPYLPWRFSLRTLLIATTLIAIVLGLIVWAAY